MVGSGPAGRSLGHGRDRHRGLQARGELVRIETLGMAAKLRTLQLFDDGFQAVDFAVAMFERGGDIEHKAMQELWVRGNILEIDLHVRFYPNQLIRRRG